MLEGKTDWEPLILQVCRTSVNHHQDHGHPHPPRVIILRALICCQGHSDLCVLVSYAGEEIDNTEYMSLFFFLVDVDAVGQHGSRQPEYLSVTAIEMSEHRSRHHGTLP